MNAAVKRFIGCIMEYALLEDGSLSMMIQLCAQKAMT